MPIYEFVCNECGQDFEELVLSAKSTQGVICPNCQSELVTKKISLFAAPAAGGKATSFWGGSPANSCSTTKT